MRGDGEMLNEWIRSIIIFTIFFSLVLYLAPDEKYKKHIQTVTGFVMIIVVVSPVLELFSPDKKLKLQYDTSSIGSFVVEDEYAYYRDVMEELVAGYLAERFSVQADVELELDEDYHIIKMELYGLEAYDEYGNQVAQDEIISEISKEYGMRKEDIFIY